MEIIVGIALLYLVVVIVLDFFGVSSVENEGIENNGATEDMAEAPVTSQFD